MSRDPEPFYTRHVFCCENKRPEGHPRGCCRDKDATPLRNYLKARIKELGMTDVRINSAGCLDRCELGPTLVIYPEGTWYHYRTLDDAEEILQRHIVEGRRAGRLQLRPGDTAPPTAIES